MYGKIVAERETVAQFTARVVAERETVLKSTAKPPQSLRLSQNSRYGRNV